MQRSIDYSLARRAVIRDLQSGALTRRDVCDAQPALMRAGTHVGTFGDHDCPICGDVKVKHVKYVYGENLKAANGRCISMPGELEKLGEDFDEFACYVVEVCVECGWNHLARRFLMGKAHAG